MGDFEICKQREPTPRKLNPLRPVSSELVDIDDPYFEEEGVGACLVCH